MLHNKGETLASCAARFRGLSLRVLFLSAWFPYPHDNGSKLRIFNLLRGLARAHEVTLYSLTEHPHAPIPPPLLEICREVVPVASRPYRAHGPRALLGLLSRRPRVLVDRRLPEMEALVRKAAQARQFDLIIASQWYMADYVQAAAGIPAIFEEIEVGMFRHLVDKATNPLARWRHKLTIFKMQRYLQELLSRFGACTVVSVEELGLLRQMVPAYEPSVVVPNGVSLADNQGDFPPARPDTLVFAGSFTYDVNYEAMRWFTGLALPAIHAERPNVGLTITGNNAGMPLPYSRNVELTGLAPDIRPIVASSWISLAPLQSGGGTRLKILEAMALGTPVVATSKGAEGLQVVSGEHLLIADSPEEFAAACLRLLGDAELRARLSRNALDLVRRNYDWEIILPRFLRLVDRVASGRPFAAEAQETPASDCPHTAGSA